MSDCNGHVLADAKSDDGVGLSEDRAVRATLDSVEGFAQPKVAERESLMP
jgi:hypothetical protein